MENLASSEEIKNNEKEVSKKGKRNLIKRFLMGKMPWVFARAYLWSGYAVLAIASLALIFSFFDESIFGSEVYIAGITIAGMLSALYFDFRFRKKYPLEENLPLYVNIALTGLFQIMIYMMFFVMLIYGISATSEILGAGESNTVILLLKQVVGIIVFHFALFLGLFLIISFNEFYIFIFSKMRDLRKKSKTENKSF